MLRKKEKHAREEFSAVRQPRQPNLSLAPLMKLVRQSYEIGP